jgi:hypothetical protein
VRSIYPVGDNHCVFFYAIGNSGTECEQKGQKDLVARRQLGAPRDRRVVPIDDRRGLE